VLKRMYGLVRDSPGSVGRMAVKQACMWVCCHDTARSRSKSVMIQETPSSEFGSHLRAKRVRSKSESVSDCAMVSLSVVFFSIYYSQLLVPSIY